MDGTQRELMSAILARASEHSASFHDALLVVAERGVGAPKALARELLCDLSIRGWIELCAQGPDDSELPIPRVRSEAQFVEPRNWRPEHQPTRYRLTEKGRSRLTRT